MPRHHTHPTYRTWMRRYLGADDKYGDTAPEVVFDVTWPADLHTEQDMEEYEEEEEEEDEDEGQGMEEEEMEDEEDDAQIIVNVQGPVSVSTASFPTSTRFYEHLAASGDAPAGAVAADVHGLSSPAGQGCRCIGREAAL